MNGPCYSLSQFRERDQAIQDAADAELEKARAAIDSWLPPSKAYLERERVVMAKRRARKNLVHVAGSSN
jgi:hypothetical protein